MNYVKIRSENEQSSISYYDTHSNGDIMSRAINDMDNIASTLQQNLAINYQYRDICGCTLDDADH